MNNQERKLWPYKPRTSIVAALLILFGLLLALIILRVAFDWPSPESERAALLGIFLLSLTPILLMLIDTMIDRGAVVEYKDIKIDFSQAQRIQIPGPTIPVNIGLPSQSIADSGTNEIIDSLRQATTSVCVVVDLEEGRAWWETRLVVLLAGAVRHNKPDVVIFVGTEAGKKKCFQGWAAAKELLPPLLNADPQYSLSYYSALAAALQWEMVEPTGQAGIQPVQPAWIQPGLATQHPGLAFEDKTGLPNPFFAEQLLASRLGGQVELEQPPRTISLVRLEELYRPILHQDHIDESWQSERQQDVFFKNDAPYVAITQNGKFKALVSRISVLNSMVGNLVREK